MAVNGRPATFQQGICYVRCGLASNRQITALCAMPAQSPASVTETANDAERETARPGRAAVERADFMMIVAGDAPDFRRICRALYSSGTKSRLIEPPASFQR